MTLVTIRLRPLGPATTELELVHSELPDDESATWHAAGWEQALEQLALDIDAGGANR